MKDNESVEKDQGRGISRRTLIAGVGGVAALTALGAIRLIPTDPLVRPPGGQDFARLAGACIRCEKCVEICPRQIIKTAHIEDGIVGMRTPILNFDKNWCNWCEEENGGVPLCVEICPTGALALPEGATRETLILGIAELDPKVCLAYMDLSCRFCYDACEFEAIALDEGDEDAALELISNQRDFFQQHLAAWAPMMTTDMKRLAKTEFYQGLAYLTEGFLQVDRGFLESVISH